MSRLPQARGLKRSYTQEIGAANKSRLPQARGLKHRCGGCHRSSCLSRLPQARGLKRMRSTKLRVATRRVSRRRVD